MRAINMCAINVVSSHLCVSSAIHKVAFGNKMDVQQNHLCHAFVVVGAQATADRRVFIIGQVVP